MNKQLLLSLCIPTNGIVEWVIPVIDSIYNQKVELSLFEVVITDNGGKNDLKEALATYTYSNLHYYQNDSKGFTNQIDAFEKGSGLFCKMLNHRSTLRPGSINNILNLIEKYKDDKPIIYFAEGKTLKEEIVECNSTDEFVKRMSYWVSWSAGTGAWKSDLLYLREKKINNTFPHTVFLFELRKESKYVIWNGKYEKQVSDKGKGGYDVFRAFSVTFMDILTDLRTDNRISLETFVSVKYDLLNFVRKLYFEDVVMPTQHTYVIRDIKKSLNVYYGDYDYFKIKSWALARAPYAYLKLFVKRVLSFVKNI